MDAQSWPIVRRENEFGLIRSALVEQQGGCGIVLFGDAGVGKTTLTRSVTQSLPSRVHWVAGTESARSIPLTRTVEGHIHRGCIRLDVSDREGLATVIRQGRGS